MSVGYTKFDLPLRYIILLLVIVIASGVGTTLFVRSYVINNYDAVYFTISALFDINGVKLSPTFAYNLTHLDGEFYAAFFILVLDGIVKIVAIGFILAGIVEVITNINVFEKLNTLSIRKMRNGIIVCGYNSLAETLCNRLKAQDKKFAIIDKDPNKIEMLRGMGFNAIRGNFTDKGVLERASIDRAKAIVFATESDFENLLGIVTSHYLNPKISIISRAREEQSITKMHRAGATLCIVPEVLAGLDLGDRISDVIIHGAYR